MNTAAFNCGKLSGFRLYGKRKIIDDSKQTVDKEAGSKTINLI
jgi:hypothetical protein